MAGKKLSAALVLCVLLGGCAFGDRTVILQYPPPPESGSAEAATPQKVAAATSGGPAIIVGQFVDQRENKKKIGFVQNTYGMETADVLAANDVAEWVRGALVTELGLNGYRAELGDASKAHADQIVVTGEIHKTLTKAYFSYNSQIDLSADVKRGNVMLSKKSYVGKGGGGVNMAATESGFGRSIALALQDALRRLVADIAKFAGSQK